MASEHLGSVIHSLQRLFGAGTVTALNEAQLLERFLIRKDESAFEAILRRHGPMVLGICRRILDDPHDVDDAFQATFLVLVKKARSIREHEVLGTWLYGVARRVAVRAKVNARRRRACEQTARESADVDRMNAGSNRLEVDELRSLLDEELGRLPERYRAPIVLCDLEDQTHEQAAEQLHCPVGTVKSRLARGRERLRSRLARRGVAPSASAFAAALAGETASASAVPMELMNLTIRAASQFAAGKAVAAGAFSAEVAALLKGTIASMTLSKLKPAAVATLLLGVTTAGTWTLFGQAPAALTPPGPQPAGAAVANAPAHERAVERFQLENGLKVILRPIRGAKTTALVVLYSIGSDHDPEGQSGLSQIINSLYVTAAAGKVKTRTLEEYSRRYPGGANAQGGDRYTLFTTEFPEKELDAELQDAAARMSDLHVTADDLARENPGLVAQNAFIFGSFPPLAAQNNARELIRPTPRGGRHGGVPEQVRALTLADVQTHWQRYYKPQNAILSLAGAVNPAAARKAIETHFARLAPGEKALAPGEPGKPTFGAVRELTVKSSAPNIQPMACLAYAAPQPDSPLYAPFLVLIARLWAGAAKLGGEPSSFPVNFTPLDDGAIVAVSAPAKTGETAQKAFIRLEAFVAETIEPKLGASELATTEQQLGFFLGTADLPDEVLQNIYGVAFSLGRRDQLAIDPAQLKRVLQAVTDQDLRRVANEVFTPGKHAAVFVSLSK